MPRSDDYRKNRLERISSLQSGYCFARKPSCHVAVRACTLSVGSIISAVQHQYPRHEHARRSNFGSHALQSRWQGLVCQGVGSRHGRGRADFAVHCLKDMPMELPPGFALAGILEREDPRDAFVSNDYAGLDVLPAGAVVGTSSLRRQALIAARYPQLVIKPLRDNLDTRLGKLDRGEYAAIILAAAGLNRLGLQHRIRALIEPEDSLPAPGQGALAFEIPADRSDLQRVLAPLNHADTALTVAAERSLSRIFGGSCQIPLVAFATLEGAQLHLRAIVAMPDGSRIASAEVRGPATDPEALGQQVAVLLRAQGADAILAACQANG